MPVPVPAPERTFTGYDWAARVHSSHLVLDAKPLASTIRLDTVPTAFIDLEITGLMPWTDGTQPRPYHLVGPTQTLPGYADHGGSAIFWNTPAEPATWILTDGRSGEPITTITMEARSFRPAIPVTWCFWCSQRAEPPKPVSSEDVQGGMVIEQAAYSFTKEARIQSSGCWKHHVAILAKASGGLAGAKGTAGADFGYTTTECGGFVSQGHPVEYRRKSFFRKDTYEDGSTKIYAISRGGDRGFKVPEVYYPPPPDAFLVEVDAGALEPFTAFKEAQAGGVFYEGGVQVFGTGVNVRFASDDQSDYEIKLVYDTPQTGTKKFKVYIANGDLTDPNDPRGIVPMVWAVPE